MKLRKALANSEHALLLPASIEQMGDESLVWLMGHATAENYLDDMRRAQEKTFRPAARSVLARVRRVDLLFQRINATSLELSGALEALQTNTVYPEDLNELIKKHFQTKSIRKGISNSATQSLITAATDACDRMQEMFSKESDDINRAPIKRAVATIRNSFAELHQHARYFAKSAKSELPCDLLAMEAAYIAARPEEGALDDAKVNYNMNYAKNMANTGHFGREDILYQMIGGRKFIRDLQSSLVARVRENYRTTGGDYMGFYINFGVKRLKVFVETTLGMALFAHENSKSLMDWSVDDVKQLKTFVSSRYQLLHDVVEGLANTKTNPLGTNLSRTQLITLMHEIFRSTIYPNYRINLRVGMGASEDSDIPIRMPGYVMNALDILIAHRRANEAHDDGLGLNLPNLTIISGAALGVRVNGFDPTAMEKRGLRIFKLIDEFVGEFYPELRDSVTFVQPSQQDVFDNDLYQGLFATVKEVTTPKIRADNKWSARVEQEQKLQIVIGTLADFAMKRINANIDQLDEATKQPFLVMARSRAIEYATAHKMPHVFGTIQEPGKSSTATWKIGCSSERHFDAFCELTASLMAPKSGFYYPNANLMSGLYGGLTTTTPIGRDLPPYYKSDKKFDPGFGEVKRILSNGDASGRQIVDRIKEENDGPAADLNMMLAHPRFQGIDGQCAWSRYASFLSRCNL